MGSSELVTNMRIIKPSRRRIRAGDVFAVRPDDLGYLFGRVIDPDTTIGGFSTGGIILAYVYAPVFSTLDPPPPEALSREALLIPPFGINRLPWVRGYFYTVDHRPLVDADVLPHHVFHDTMLARNRLVDEHGRPTERGDGPVGEWVLQGYGSLDDLISRALGIPPTPDPDP